MTRRITISTRTTLPLLLLFRKSCSSSADTTSTKTILDRIGCDCDNWNLSSRPKKRAVFQESQVDFLDFISKGLAVDRHCWRQIRTLSKEAFGIVDSLTWHGPQSSAKNKDSTREISREHSITFHAGGIKPITAVFVGRKQQGSRRRGFQGSGGEVDERKVSDNRRENGKNPTHHWSSRQTVLTTMCLKIWHSLTSRVREQNQQSWPSHQHQPQPQKIQIRLWAPWCLFVKLRK